VTRLSPIDVRKAGPDDARCPACPRPVERGQRLALVRSDQLGHAWVHLRHIAEPPADDRREPTA
jgi:hypothetical protein